MTPEPNVSTPPQIELPEEQPVLGEERWREIALYLYAQLDNIDTLYDMCKTDLQCFHHNVAKYHPKRHEVARTDGYRVIFVPATTAALAGGPLSTEEQSTPSSSDRD